MLGGGNYEGNSSDSAEEKAQNSKDAGDDNGCESQLSESNENLKIDGAGILSQENTNNNNNLDKLKCSDERNDCDNSDLQQNNSLAQDKNSSGKNEIPPPPGAPRPENTARLRRYRLNLE